MGLYCLLSSSLQPGRDMSKPFTKFSKCFLCYTMSLLHNSHFSHRLLSFCLSGSNKFHNLGLKIFNLAGCQFGLMEGTLLLFPCIADLSLRSVLGRL